MGSGSRPGSRLTRGGARVQAFLLLLALKGTYTFVPAASQISRRLGRRVASSQRFSAQQISMASSKVCEPSSVFGMPLASTLAADFQRVEDLRESHWRVPERQMPNIVTLRQLFEKAKPEAGNSPLTEEECMEALTGGGFMTPSRSVVKARRNIFEPQRGERWISFRIFTEVRGNIDPPAHPPTHR